MRRRFSLSVKTAAAISTSLSIAMLGAIATSIVQYHKLTLRAYQDKGERVTALLAEMLNRRERVDELLTYGREAEYYDNMVQELDNVLRTSPEVCYIYAYQVRAEDCLVIFDMDVPGLEADDPGTVVQYDETVEKYAELFRMGAQVPADTTVDEYGWLFSV